MKHDTSRCAKWENDHQTVRSGLHTAARLAHKKRIKIDVWLEAEGWRTLPPRSDYKRAVGEPYSLKM